ncbi:hypothetical protein [Thermodesulfitimonas sp.]
MKRVAGAVLARLGSVILAFCAWFAVSELVPASVKMRQTGPRSGWEL